MPLVGVDIAPEGVRVVELQSAARGLRISHHAQVPLAADAWQSALDGDPQALVASLKHAWKASGSRLRNAALALPASAVITRTLCLPQPDHDDELAWLVEADAAQSLPFPRDEISLDFANLGPAANEEGMVDVLLVAARSERIAQRVAWVEAAGLKPVVVGEDPLNPERINQRLWKRGRTTTARSIGAVDVALWDIAGKVFNRPVRWHPLRCRRHLPTFANQTGDRSQLGVARPERQATQNKM